MAIAQLKENGLTFTNYDGVKINKKSYFDDNNNALIGTTRVIGMIFPFGDVINVSPVAKFWGEKILRRLKSNQPKQETESIFDMDISEDLQVGQEAMAGALKAKEFFNEQMSIINRDGNYAGEYAAAEIEGRPMDEKDEFGGTYTKTERGHKYALKLLEEFEKLGDVEFVGSEVALYENGIVGKYDMLVRDKETNGLILIDFKTGSEIKKGEEKETKLKLQLGFYAHLVKLHYREYPTRIIGITAYEKETKRNGNSYWGIGSKTIEFDRFDVKIFTDKTFFHNAETYKKNKLNGLIK